MELRKNSKEYKNIQSRYDLVDTIEDKLALLEVSGVLPKKEYIASFLNDYFSKENCLSKFYDYYHYYYEIEDKESKFLFDLLKVNLNQKIKNNEVRQAFEEYYYNSGIIKSSKVAEPIDFWHNKRNAKNELIPSNSLVNSWVKEIMSANPFSLVNPNNIYENNEMRNALDSILQNNYSLDEASLKFAKNNLEILIKHKSFEKSKIFIEIFSKFLDKEYLTDFIRNYIEMEDERSVSSGLCSFIKYIKEKIENVEEFIIEKLVEKNKYQVINDFAKISGIDNDLVLKILAK